jgi:hypothetical protein
MLWIITNDYCAEQPGASHVGRVSTHSAMRATKLRNCVPAEKPALVERWKNECNFEFQLLDDDGNLLYAGVCKNLDNAMQEEAFEPLDWAMDDAGATEMQYRKKGEQSWSTL